VDLEVRREERGERGAFHLYHLAHLLLPASDPSTPPPNLSSHIFWVKGG